MKKITVHYPLLLLIIFMISIVGCQQYNDNEFLITKSQVGLILKNTKIDEIPALFENDSVIESEYKGELRYASKQHITILDKAGNQLLKITPTQDSLKVISHIQILSSAYTTKKGISNKSTFGELKKNYTINSIENAYNNVIVSVTSLNAYFVIDKKHLPFHLQMDHKKEITEKDIPNDTPIKYFMISWN